MPMNTRRLWIYLSLAAVVYVGFFGATFLADPLGQAPVLDARENLAWAQQIREGGLPEEPLYRALLYPLLLSCFPAASFPVAATLLGLTLHLCSAVLVGLIARRLWRYDTAAWLSGLTFAVYPVALYFAGQVLDITLSMTLFLGAVYLLFNRRGTTCDARVGSVPGPLRTSPMRRFQLFKALQVTPLRAYAVPLLAGLLGGLAVLTRPNFLPAVLCFPVVVLLAKSRGEGSRKRELLDGSQPRPWKASLAVVVGLALMLALQGLVNLKLSGEFRLLPWQGAYNLFAANREGANGKYYMQQLAFDDVPAGANPTRMESELYYRYATKAQAPMTIDAMNAFWREKFVESIADDPIKWLGLMVRKSTFIVNNWEQYNNLTYAYHKSRWPVLAWNPLGWGVLLLAACAGLIVGYRESSRSTFYGIALIGLAYAAGLLLFFVSARFRLPLAPLLCVAAGGCVFWPQHAFTPRQRGCLLAGLAGLAVLSFGNWFQAKDRATYIQDELLLAKASSQAGDDTLALNLARDVLARDPDRAEAQRLEVTSLFNLWLVTGESFHWLDLGGSLEGIRSEDAAVDFIRGVYHWRELRPNEAVATWQSAVDEYGLKAQSSLDALQAVGQLPVEPERSPAVEQMRTILELD